MAEGHSAYSQGGGLRWLSIGLMAIASTGWAAPDLSKYGQTQLQQDTGASVQATCGDLAADEDITLDNSPLFSTCNAMVQTSVDLDGDSNNGRSLMISADELAAGLQQVATEEFAAAGQLGTEIGSNSINIGINRLIEVRKGARGFSIAGLNPDSKTLLAADSQWFNSYTGGRGGAAGDSDVWNKLGFFITGNYSTGDRDRTDRTDEFDFDTYGLTLGLDYRFMENFVLGAAVSYNDVGSDFTNRPTVAGGGVDADGWGGFVYGTYYQDRFYIDGLAGYARSDYDINRKIFIPNNNPAVNGGNDLVATAKANPDSNDFTLSAGGGYYFGQDALSYGPYARLTYLNIDVDDYREKGAEAIGLNLDVDGQDWKSFTSVLGGQISFASSHSFGVLVPQGRLAWVHEFENDARDMVATYVDDPFNNELIARTDSPDRDYFELGLGVSAVFKNGVQAFFNYDTVLGLDDLTVHYFSLGGRWEF
ncbi:MAG: autotransporter outer membrane beta-barrel domain-containing protein [Pseudomonadota bacterium]